MAAAEVGGAQSKGLYVYLKHFVCNDNDQNRGGMYTWINEQELREIQLGMFEYAVKEENCTGLMMAYNRVGPCECSVSYGLNTTVLQKEWGYRGASVTDGYSAAIGCDKYEHPDLQLRAGAGLLLYTGGFAGTGGLSSNSTDTEAGIAMMHDMAKKIVYRHANSNAMSISRDYSPTWIWLIVGLNLLLLGLAFLAYWFLVRRSEGKSRKVGWIVFLCMIVCAVILALICFVRSGAFGGSGGETAKGAEPDVVSDFTFDFVTGEYAFADVSNAKNYYLRVFEADPSDEMVEMPVAARRVRDSEGADRYEGVLDMNGLNAGESYKAYVYTYAKDASGDLVFVRTEPLVGVYKTAYSTSSGAGVTAYREDGGVTVLLKNSFFTTEYLNKAPNYVVTLYKDGNPVEAIELTADQVERNERQEESSSGRVSTVIECSASVRFTGDGDSVTVQVISTDDSAYYNSAESAPVAVLDEAPAEEASDEAAGDASGEASGETASDEAAGEAPSDEASGDAASGEACEG